MEAVNWLPPEPLTLEGTSDHVQTFEYIELCAPMVGVRPDPYETIVLLYVGLPDKGVYTALDPEIPSWVTIDGSPERAPIPWTKACLEGAMTFLESRYPDATFAAFREASLSR